MGFLEDILKKVRQGIQNVGNTVQNFNPVADNNPNQAGNQNFWTQQAAPTINRAVQNVGDFVSQDIQRTPIARDINTLRQIPSAIQHTNFKPLQDNTAKLINSLKPIAKPFNTLSENINMVRTDPKFAQQLPSMVNQGIQDAATSVYGDNRIARTLGKTVGGIEQGFTGLLTTDYTRKNPFEKAGDVLAGVGAVTKPGTGIGFGAFNSAIKGGQNLIEGKPILQDTGKAYDEGLQSGFQFAALEPGVNKLLSPLTSKIAPTEIKNINQYLDLAKNATSQEAKDQILKLVSKRIVQNVAKNSLTGAVTFGSQGAVAPAKNTEERIHNILTNGLQGGTFGAGQTVLGYGGQALTGQVLKPGFNATKDFLASDKAQQGKINQDLLTGGLASKLEKKLNPDVANAGLYDTRQFANKDLQFMHNPEKAPNLGTRMGQNLEPSGKYVNLLEKGQTSIPQGWEQGKVNFKKPLVVDWGGAGENGWKGKLSNKYGGLTGKDLSKAIAKDGYDGIITMDKGIPQEVVSLKSHVAQQPIADIKPAGVKNLDEILQPSQKPFSLQKPLSGKEYDVFNNAYRNAQEDLMIDRNLQENLPKNLTGKQAFNKMNNMGILGQEGDNASNVVQELKKLGYTGMSPENASGLLTKEPLQLKEVFQPKQPKQVSSLLDLPKSLETNRNLNNSDLPTSNPIIPQQSTAANRLADNVKGLAENRSLNQAQVMIAQEVRSTLNPSQIKAINNLKKIVNSKAFKEGDIETLRKSGKGDIVESALQSVKEARPDIKDEAQALDFALNLPTKAETTIKRVILSPEDKALRVQALQEQTAFEKDFGRHGTPAEQNKAIREWEAQINKETISQNQFNANKTKAFNDVQRNKERTFKQDDKEYLAQLSGTKAFKNGKVQDINSGFPGQALASKEVKDKAPFSYQRETLLRNIEDTFKGKSAQVKSYFHDPIVANETKATNFRNELRQNLTKTFDSFGIGRGSKEDYAAADFIEGGKTLDQLKTEFPNKWQSIVNGAEQGRTVYKDLLNKTNAALSKFGYSPIPERQNYVTHTAQIQTLMDRFGNMLNFTKEKLPTEISAINVDTKPGRQFFKFGLKRQGGSTHEGLITALDKYIEPASNQIFHTEDIQRGRALLKQLSEGASPQDKGLSNFNSYLGQYVDSLAGKKNIIDRPFEKVLGRGVLTLGDMLRKRTGANMVGGNASSAITNFIPFTQSIATTSKPAVVKGLYEAAISPAKGLTNIDGVESGFLTRRFPTEQIGSTLGSKARDAAGFLFKTVDGFTSKSIVAGKYFEGISKGLDKTQAMARADEYAARVLADRSLGQTPLLFNSKVLGAFTQFQTEVNNQVSFLMKDIPKNSGYNKLQVASALTQFAIYSYVFNNVYEKVTGRRPQIDPIHAGLNLQSKIQSGSDIKNIIDPTSQNTPVGELVQNLPFASIPSGGRIPIGAAVPDLIGLAKGETTLGKELVKPLTYIAPPLGGGQIKKAIEGVGAYNQGASTTAKGNVRFPIEQNLTNRVKTSLFGQYSTPESKQYFDSNAKPLSEKQSEVFKSTGDKQSLYTKIIGNRQDNKDKKNGKTDASGNSMSWTDNAGKTQSIDFNKKENTAQAGSLASFKTDTDNATKARKIYNAGGGLTAQQKQDAFKKLGYSEDEIRYDVKADFATAQKADYIANQKLDHSTLLNRLVDGRRESVSGKKFAADGVLDDLYKQNLISSAERTALKKIKLDSKGNPLAGSGGTGKGGTGKGGKGKSSKARSKAISDLAIKSHTDLAKVFQSQVKNSSPSNARKLSSILTQRSPSNTGLKSIEAILKQSENLVKNRKNRNLKTILAA